MLRDRFANRLYPALISETLLPQTLAQPTTGTARLSLVIDEPEGGCFKITNSENPEVSVVMPCLNEADTLSQCLRKASMALVHNGIEGEIIVADNGSTDSSLA